MFWIIDYIFCHNGFRDEAQYNSSVNHLSFDLDMFILWCWVFQSSQAQTNLGESCQIEIKNIVKCCLKQTA